MVLYSRAHCFSEKLRLNVKVSRSVRLRVRAGECGDGTENKSRRAKRYAEAWDRPRTWEKAKLPDLTEQNHQCTWRQMRIFRTKEAKNNRNING